MNFSLASSSPEPQCCASECMQRTCASFPLSRPPISTSCLIKKNNIQAIRSGAGRRAISSQLMPNHIEESYRRNKHLQLPIKKLDFVRTLLIDNYDSYTYNIYQALSVVNGVPPVVVKNDDLTWKELCHYLYEENAFDNIVISPGPGSPACPKDIGICLELLHKCWDIPILGVCLGHQALGLVHGAQVAHAPEPIHGRLSELEHNGCELFHEIPSGRNSGFKVIGFGRIKEGKVFFSELIVWLGQNGRDFQSSRPAFSFSLQTFLSYPENQNCTGRGYVKWNPLLKDSSKVTLLAIVDGHLKIIFEVVRYHSLAIDPESLPPELIPIAWTDSAVTLLRSKESNNTKPSEALTKRSIFSDSVSAEVDDRSSNPSSHYDLTRRTRVLMGIKHSTRPHYGLQFHPESIATSHGTQIFKNFREITDDYWLRFGSSYNRGKHVHSAVNFLCSSQLAREVHSSVNPENNAVNQQNKESPRDGHLMHDTAETDASEMSNMVNHNHASIAYKWLKLKWRRFDHLASQVGGAKNIFCGLFGRHKAENSFWLDSSSTEYGRARFSFMGGKGGSLWKQLSFRLSDQRNGSLQGGGFMSIEDGEGSTKSMFLENGFFDFLNKELQSFRYSEKDFEGLPFDFHGGYIGYIGYDLKLECGDTSNRHKSRTPDACFFFADNLIAIDHLNDDVYILCIHDGSQTMTPWLDDTEEKLMNLKNSVTRKMKRQEPLAPTFSPLKAGFVAEKSRKQYIDDVNKCLSYIKDGESYELCLTTQIRKTIKELNSLGLYLRLRERNPAPYAAWLNFSNDDLCICCSSPERFLKLDRNGILEAKPIKGTIARGATEEDDERLRLKLKFSEKDQAENLMIVDLLRNDLGRVCEPGSVHVPRLMDVESYATVHTMVSTIRGKKLSHVSAVDCVKAAFPGGSMTGAPKLRSMELLDSLESCSRGIYSGCIGFFSYDQTFDLNIVIRTVIIHEGEVSIGAGGAIVALSNPEDEYEEMILKTQAPAKAVIYFE